MKKHTVIALASALTIAAGSVSAGVGTADSLSLKEESSAAENAASSGTEADETGLSYDEAIAQLYARSTSISDQEILEIAGKMRPDGTAVENLLGAEEAQQIMNAVSDYEQDKAAYLLGDTTENQNIIDQNTKNQDMNSGSEALSREWEKQQVYTMTCMSPAQTLTSLIPGYTVTSCREENGQILLDVDEWMTEGYTEGEDRETENVSAYRYYFTAVMEKEKDGSWTVASVVNTERNFTWLEDAQVQEKEYKTDSADLYADAAEANRGELNTEAAAAADTAAQKLRENGLVTSSLETYGDGRYNYNPDKAVAYADKWATSRNPDYRQYPGVDCCNFVSQCLYAGGMPKNGSWYPASYAWINCSGAIANFKKYGSFMSANDGNVLRGNPVYYDWNSNGVYDHTAICVGRNSAGTPIIDAHTGDHYHAAWRLGGNGTRATIQLRSNGSSSGGDNQTKKLAGTWKKKNGKWYYYTSDGSLAVGWLEYKNETYYLNKNGQMATGWKKVGKSWYYFAKSGEMRTGWLKLGTRKFYLADSGKMKTGWVNSGGKWYYMCSEGYAVTGWRTVNGEEYYLDKNGVMQTGLTRIDGKTYYFDSQGRKTLGWVTVGGRKYFFSPSAGGRAATGNWDINDVIYYFNNDGVLVG